jgi:pimeloyl-ACP methyl ester carboxylesterase
MSIDWYAWIGVAAVALFLIFGLRYVVPGSAGTIKFLDGAHKTLVVFGPPLGGRTSVPDLENLLRTSFASADFIIPTYSNSFISNTSPSEMASMIELAIRSAHQRHNYSRIVLFGYSTGGLLLRKAYVWGHGSESDRATQHGQHPWVDRVERFVSLAAPNRGWPTSKPANLRMDQYVLAHAAQIFFRLTNTGKVVLDLLQGSPFVANMRVQWIALFRAKGADAPLVVHLVGGKDELVNREDSIDIEAGGPEHVVIRTLEGLNHLEIANGIYQTGADKAVLTSLAEDILTALTNKRGEFPNYWPDKIGALKTDPNIKQLIFVMHGIRDESNWPLDIKRAIEKKIREGAEAVKVIPPQYRRFTMLPFLLYWDRQENVRWFMDQYTEAIATYPNLQDVDFVGHSNGTYILASALQKYSVLRVRNVFFAGSVAPIQYNWKKVVQNGQVTGKVWNICADYDWVVAILPQLFQQLSDWMKIEPEGLLDIGSAGFRGFRNEVGTNSSVENLRYISGTHGAAFDSGNEKRLQAIVDFVTSGEESKLRSLSEVSDPPGWLALASYLSWLIWMIGLGLIAFVGLLAYKCGWQWLAVYVAVILGIVTTV